MPTVQVFSSRSDLPPDTCPENKTYSRMNGQWFLEYVGPHLWLPHGNSYTIPESTATDTEFSMPPYVVTAKFICQYCLKERVSDDRS